MPKAIVKQFGFKHKKIGEIIWFSPFEREDFEKAQKANMCVIVEDENVNVTEIDLFEEIKSEDN